MAEQQYIMTKKGYDEAVEKLKYLQTVKRQEIVERIAEARSHGDLSENAEYDAARNEQAANEGEIADLESEIFKTNQEIASLKNVETSIQLKYKERAGIKGELNSAEEERKKVSDLIVKQNNYNVYTNYLLEADNYKKEIETKKGL